MQLMAHHQNRAADRAPQVFNLPIKGPRMMKVALPVALATLTTIGISRADVASIAEDIAPVHSLVAQVMGEIGNPALVVSPGASPHRYSLRPSEAQALQDADFVFWVSAGLTPWLADTVVTLTMGLGTALFNILVAGSGVAARRLAYVGSVVSGPGLQSISAGLHIVGGLLVVG